MNEFLQPHQSRIQKVGRLLWVFSWIWLIFNIVALGVVMAGVLALGLAGDEGNKEGVITMFAGMPREKIGGVTPEALRALLTWDYDSYLDHYWISFCYLIVAFIIFVATMTLILRIAAAWKIGDVFGDRPIKSIRLLGWIYLVHGIVGQAWGMLGQFMGASHTAEILYFSFIRDVSLYTFTMSGTGIEWGLLALALSWILEHARLLREEQQLTV
jgi:hypothetical protein